MEAKKQKMEEKLHLCSDSECDLHSYFSFNHAIILITYAAI